MITPSVEFRIPISPTRGFYAQVRFFNFALRRLGGGYEDALLKIVVGDRCNLLEVRRQNDWSLNYNIQWERVPDAIFDEFGIHGTANWRFMAEPQADVVVLSDADTILLRDINPLLTDMPADRPAIAGHMAHGPPPVRWLIKVPDPHEEAFWLQLFSLLNLAPPDGLHRYSMDRNSAQRRSPPYFNLGFIALNSKALDDFRSDIFDWERRFKTLADSHMRCQIACTAIGLRHDMAFLMLPAEYNAANDRTHLSVNRVEPSEIRVLHYLREDEVRRSETFLPETLPGFLRARLNNPANALLQRLAREYAAAISLIG